MRTPERLYMYSSRLAPDSGILSRSRRNHARKEEIETKSTGREGEKGVKGLARTLAQVYLSYSTADVCIYDSAVSPRSDAYLSV